ncbi:unnamed protein product [Spirodela intermedia]|uniref:Uncharacterized protein n=1 Tax=Spirodela intermedia TaxID=51605 RepID=A0A7I8KIX5_SPIIN|nr:unnamed protein product [Spirodela intermedia]
MIKWLAEENKKEIKASSMVFSCPRSSCRKDYLEHIKIIIDQASLSLRLAHNKNKRRVVEKKKEEKRERRDKLSQERESKERKRIVGRNSISARFAFVEC